MRTLTTVLLVLLTTTAKSQKLPNVQKESVRVPANVKIDGKADEWGGFKARNPATDILYTMSNDDKKLYVAIYVEAGMAVNRAAVGGITLIVQSNGSKNQQGAAGIKFPYFEKGKLLGFPIKKPGEVSTEAQSDSIMRANNQRIATNFKYIFTKGIPGVDSVLAVYNDKGIEAAASFDEKRGYTCEMAIDLGLLGLTLPKQFSYYIGINTEPNKISSPIAAIPPKSGKNADGTDMTEAQLAAAAQRRQNSQQPVFATTDFWGEYTLAK